MNEGFMLLESKIGQLWHNRFLESMNNSFNIPCFDYNVWYIYKYTRVTEVLDILGSTVANSN